jgi:hypothetical protein
MLQQDRQIKLKRKSLPLLQIEVGPAKWISGAPEPNLLSLGPKFETEVMWPEMVGRSFLEGKL